LGIDLESKIVPEITSGSQNGLIYLLSGRWQRYIHPAERFFRKVISLGFSVFK
jgi:hypothetical protein